jgi:hypothetical protein
MLKSELKAKCKELKFRIPFQMIFDLYEDDEDIPEVVITNLFLLESRSSKEFVVYGNDKFWEEVDKAIDEDLKKLINNG